MVRPVCTGVHLCLACYPLVVAVRARLPRRRVSARCEAAAAVRPRSSSIRRRIVCERYAVLLAAEGGEHARVVVERGDRGAEAAAERFAAGAAAQVVVAARPGRLGDDLQLARVGLQLEHRLARRGRARARAACRRAGARSRSSRASPSRRRFSSRSRGDDVEPVGELVGAVDHAAERRRHDVGHALPLERLQERDTGRTARARISGSALSSIACRRSCGDRRSAFSQARVVLRVRLVGDERELEVEAAGAQQLAAASRSSAGRRRAPSGRAGRGPCRCARESSTCESPARVRASRISVPLVTRQVIAHG